MCGIAGYLSLTGEPASAATAERMGEAIAHRGPDDRGVFSDGAVALAHRRLSIIDLTKGGAQPMQTGNCRFTVVYKGVIYK
ncbi:MAG: hypothetical protein ACTHLY_17785 [Pseudolabrys sp.]